MEFANKKLTRALVYASRAIIVGMVAAAAFSPIASTAVQAQSASAQVGPFIEGGELVNTGTGAVTAAPPAGYRDPAANNSLGCGLSSTLDPAVCLSNVIYAFTVGLGGGLAYVGGFMFDTTVSLSLNSAAYALDFLSSGWTTARDLANMAFILILVYIAFTIMFQAETAGTMKMLAWVIFIALIINFSFFLTRVVIDAGNILAVQFYNAIDAPPMQQSIDATNISTGALASAGAGIASTIASQGTLQNTKDLTFSIMKALNIQELFNDNNFKAFARANGFGTKFITLSFLYIAIGACYFILAAMFFAVAVKFLMRIVVLWFLIIASPLAFICKAVPNKPEISGWYDKWQSELINHAFYPAFFLFIFFFISTVMAGLTGSTGIVAGLATDLAKLSSMTETNGFIYIASAVANVGIRLGFVIAMLYIALKASEYMGVQGAQVAHGITNRIGGLAKYSASLPVRGAFGAAAWTGRNTAGRGAYLLSRTSGMQNIAANSIFGRPVKAALGGLEKATFDIRGTSVGKNIKAVAGEAGGKGGFGAQISNRAKNIEARAKELKETDEKMVRKAQANYESNVYAGGKSAFDRRKDELTRRGNAATKEEKKELNDMLGAGKKQLDDAAKLRIKAFADRLGNRNLQNLGWPSRGSIEGAAKALKTISGKSKEQTAIDALKELNKDDDAGAAPAATPAPAPAAHPLSRQTMEATSQRGPLSASTEKLERAMHKQVEALNDATSEFKEVSATLDRGFSGLRKTVKETLERNGGSRPIDPRGRSGRPMPMPAAPVAPEVQKPADTTKPGEGEGGAH